MADRSYVAGRFFFNLDGVKCGFVKSAEGGGVTAEVIAEPIGPDHFAKKHLGNVKYEDIKLNMGMSMSKAIYQWIEASWKNAHARKDGSIDACDHDLNVRSSRQFFKALITETVVPAVDGSSKEAAYMTVALSPEWTRVVKGSGKASAELGKSEQKFWSASNFRLDIKGLNCKMVNKIDSFTIKQSAVEDHVGDGRDYAKEPGKLEFPNLKISMSSASSDDWYKWHEEMVVKGNNDESAEKDGSLVFLSPNREKELARINFFNLGIFKIAADKSEANSDSIRRDSAELYCERMEFEYLAGVIG